MIKKVLALLVAASATVGLTACNERQVATGAAVVGGALIAGAIADNYYNRNRNYYYYNDRYYGNGYYGRGYNYGYGYNDGYGYGYGGRRGGYWWNSSNDLQQGDNQDDGARLQMTAAGNDEIRPEQALAQKYKMPVRAAGKVLNLFERVKASGSLESLNAMGVGQNELQAIANGAAPSAEIVGGVAKSLGASPASVRALFADFAREYAQAQGEHRL